VGFIYQVPKLRGETFVAKCLEVNDLEQYFPAGMSLAKSSSNQSTYHRPMKCIFLITTALLGFAGLALAEREIPAFDQNQAKAAIQDALNKAKNAIGKAKDAGKIDEEKAMYDAEREALREALKAELATLGKDATREEVNAVAAKFRDENKALIEAQRATADELRNAAKEAKDLERDNVPEGVKQLRALLDQSKLEKKDSKDEFKAALEGAESAEDRRGLFDEHLAEQREHHKQFRDDLKKLREELRSNNDGVRRAE
jgi:antitoxin component HigA of HigAB toxin-antitoxin module